MREKSIRIPLLSVSKFIEDRRRCSLCISHESPKVYILGYVWSFLSFNISSVRMKYVCILWLWQRNRFWNCKFQDFFCHYITFMKTQRKEQLLHCKSIDKKMRKTIVIVKTRVFLSFCLTISYSEALHTQFRIWVRRRLLFINWNTVGRSTSRFNSTTKRTKRKASWIHSRRFVHSPQLRDSGWTGIVFPLSRKLSAW